MPFVIPTFILPVNIWRATSGPPNPPDGTCMGNLSVGRRMTMVGWPGEEAGSATVQLTLLVPKGTDLRDEGSPPGEDIVEVPAGSGRVYHVIQVDDVGKGFANEFRFAALSKLAPWPAPIP